MAKKNKLYIFSILLITLVFLSSCVKDHPPPDVIYSDNYTTTIDTEHKQFPSNIELTRDQALNTVLANNPGYQSQQDKAIAAQNRYYASLGKLAPNAAITNTTITTGVDASIPKTMNILSEHAKSKEAKYSAQNYARKLTEDVKTNYNNMEKNKGIVGIEEANENFQKQMAQDTLKKYKNGQVSASDVLNFQVKANMAKAAAIEAQRKYGIASIELASKMGMTTAQLPVNSSPSRKIGTGLSSNRKPVMPKFDLNYYLDLAIENRPDLKADKEALKSARYKLYGAWGGLAPAIGGSTSNSASSGTIDASLDGSKITNIREKEAKLDIKQQELMKKWISVVKEVKSEYIKLKALLSIREKLIKSMRLSKIRRDLIVNQYNNNTADIAKLNQAQKTLNATRKRLVKTEADISNARAKLCAACGIEIDDSKHPSIATLNQAQKMYIDASTNYAETSIGSSNVGARFKAAIGDQSY